jgi:Cu(I)/Ag(I) efflux system membrane fusion protein
MIVAGMKTGDRIQIKSGLNTGDIIVIAGVHLISSEYILRTVSALWRE